ncbi:MAG: glycosyltransferase [Candidatus Margulisbacteria bacterium]|nr:glycosyltransferase [Candidatus Margulisiibacteriota bacterium]
MNIGIYTESYKPYLSGVTVSVDTFAKSLVNLGERVYIFAPAYPSQEDKNNNPWVFRFFSLGTHLYKGFRVAFPFSWRYKKYIENINLDVIHTQYPYIMGWKAYFTARKLKIPFIYTFHTLFTEYLHFVPLVPQFISAPIVRFLVRFFCNNLCDYVITPTEKAKKILEEEYKVKTPIEAIPTGVAEEEVKQASAQGIREKYNIKEGTFLLLYVGRFSKEKNIYFLLRMMQKIKEKEKNLDIRLMLIARGPLTQDIKNYVKKQDLEQEVVFTGEVQRKDIFNHYKAANLFVCASKTETQGLVISEAKACALPGVAINAAGVTAMIENGVDGYLVEENEEIFSQRVLELAQDKEKLLNFSQAARKSAEARFLDKTVAQMLLEIYKKAKELKVVSQ